MNHDLAAVANLLPDVPQWVEVRSMLLRGQARLIGAVGTSPPSFVTLHEDGDQAIVVGPADPPSILEAARSASEILASADDTPWVATVLPDWKLESAILYLRPASAPLPNVAPADVRFLDAADMATIGDGRARGDTVVVPKDLWSELRDAERSGVPIAASFEEGHPAAFCYAGSITEGLWDVSIDTLGPYQRRGHATRAVRFLIEHYRGLGKEPVWGALVENRASRSLAARLGFEQVGTLSIFTAPRVVDN